MAGPEPLIQTKNIRLNVVDCNDEVPLFGSPSYGLRIAENSVSTTLVDRTEATDTDISPLYHKLKYSLRPLQQSDSEEWDKFQLGEGTFTINEDTGKLQGLQLQLTQKKKLYSDPFGIRPAFPL